MELSEKYTVSSFLDDFNHHIAYEYREIEIEGEVAEFKINQGRWVFFNLKDEGASLGCFMVLAQLRMPIEDGMKIIVKGTPKLTSWGKFSFTVRSFKLVGAGDLRRSFELLKQKLTKEGLFNIERKRPLPENLTKIGVISSTAAAGFIDFVKILNERWGGMEVMVAHTMVQGDLVPDQMIKALNYLNQRTDVQLIAIMRGGGSADDLSCFNDENLVRAVAGSRLPVITGIGHEIDVSLVDLAADIVASTPSNLAEMISRDKKAEIKIMQHKLMQAGQKIKSEIIMQIRIINNKIVLSGQRLKSEISNYQREMQRDRGLMREKIIQNFRELERNLAGKKMLIESYNPKRVLERGYAILRGEIVAGANVEIITDKNIINAEVKNVQNR